MLSSAASDRGKLFAEKFFKISNLDNSGISLPVFPSRTNLKLLNISVTLKMVKKVISNLDFSKASDPDCIPFVVLKKCEPELSYILAELFNRCLKESCCTTLLVLFLWLVKSLKNNRIVAFLLISNMVLGPLNKLQIF